MKHVSKILQSSWQGIESGSLSAIVGNYKSLVTRRINNLRRTPGSKLMDEKWKATGGKFHLQRDDDYPVAFPLQMEIDL